MDDPFDLRPVFREHWPNYRPEWDELIELGIDIPELMRIQSLTPEQRLRRLQRMQRTASFLRKCPRRG
jgi:hypothetical protein